MNGSISKLSRVLGAAALGGVLLASAGCEEAAKQCGIACPEDSEGNAYGVVEGNASISGFAPIDGFFQSVVNFNKVATGVAADIQTEVDGIAATVGLDPADLRGTANVGAMVAAKLKADFNAELTVVAQPPKCEVDAKLTAEVSAQCQAKAGCDIDPGSASVTCEGKCTVEASAEGKCEANADLKCEVTGPKVACQGECSGSCTVTGSAAATCSGTCTGTCGGMCEGTCSGACMGDTDTGAGCKGMCMGTCTGSCSAMCNGSCELSGMAALDCKGECSGSCTATAPSGGCTGSAKATCELKAEAKAECTGKCEGEFTPPKADCDAAASCEASAKADAKFTASCTPPRLDIDFKLSAALNADAQARFDFVMADLRVRLPRLYASLKKGNLVTEAGTELVGDGQAAIESTVSALADGEVGVVAAFRIAQCVPGELKKVDDVISDAAATLKGSYCAGLSLGTGLGSSMDGLNGGGCSSS
jgi:hypothetical protein